MEKCKVLELIGGSLTDGGAETLVKDYVLNIDKERFETAVFVDWKISEMANTKKLTDSGQLIFTAYPNYSLFWRGINKFFRKTFMIRGIKKAIRLFNPDAIHIHLAALQYLLFVKEDLKGIKLFYTCHSTVKAKLIDNPEEDTAANRLSHEFGMRFIALHDSMADELNERYGVKNSIVINNGIDIERFHNVKETKVDIRKTLGIPEQTFVVGHVGRFVDVKNHDFILKVFEKVHEEKPDSLLLLIGDGEQLEQFKDRVKAAGLEKSVLILSNRSDIPQLLKAMDVFVFPSIFEGLGIALIEAQAAKLRCIVSKNVPKEAFVSELVIPLSLSDSLDSWCDAILDSKRRGPYEDRLEEFNIKSAVRKLEKVYLGQI